MIKHEQYTRHIENYMKVANFLKEHGGASPSQIAKLLGVSVERGRQILQRFVTEGYAKKIANGVVVPTERFYEQFK